MLICLTARCADISGDCHVVSMVQTQETTGRSTNENGQKFSGVNIIVKGTSIARVSDTDGKYSLQVPAGRMSLVYSLIGYA
jgi:hypothetical protein